jgi:hypothetical protein
MIDSWHVVHSNTNMTKKTSALRAYLKAETFLHMPAVYDPLGARLVEQAGFEAAYVGGYVTGGSQAITEPLLTMTEQVDVAEAVASSIDIPVLADTGAGFGEPCSDPGIRHQGQVCLPRPRSRRPGFPHHRSQRYLPGVRARGSLRSDQSRRRCRRRSWPAVPAQSSGSRESPEGL